MRKLIIALFIFAISFLSSALYAACIEPHYSWCKDDAAETREDCEEGCDDQRWICIAGCLGGDTACINDCSSSWGSCNNNCWSYEQQQLCYCKVNWCLSMEVCD